MTLLVLALTVRLLGSVAYTIATYRRTARPSLVSWCFWTSTPLIAGAAQHLDGRGAAAWLTMSYALGPAVILGPHWALFFSVLADTAAAVPTLLKTYRRPGSEPVRAYLLSVLAGALALLGLGDWRLGSVAFAVGVMAIDVSIVAPAVGGRRRKRRNVEVGDAGPTSLVWMTME
ncbi:hypothetical protein [Kribbella sp. NPDC051718]|uniref:hypothetical protein n=1 Tax=Kribbella sp. NPDC051718 TaxID=3155168 RepID=UPI003414CD7B